MASREKRAPGELTQFCRAWTALRVPAISLPLEAGAHGLPIAILVVAHPDRDDLLLAAAARSGTSSGVRAERGRLIRRRGQADRTVRTTEQRGRIRALGATQDRLSLDSLGFAASCPHVAAAGLALLPVCSVRGRPTPRIHGRRRGKPHR